MKFLNHICQHAASVVVVILVLILTHWVWVFDFSILSSGDWGYLYQDQKQELLSLPSIWDSRSLGSPNIVNPTRYPLHLFQGSISHFFDSPLVDRLSIFYVVLLGGVFSYVLLFQVSKSRIGAVVGSFVYSYNTYVLSTDNLLLLSAFAIAPLAFALFIQALQKRTIFSAFLTGLVLFVLSFYEFRAFYILAWVFLFYTIFYLLFIQANKNLWSTFQTLLYAVIPVVIVGVLSLYWVVPLSHLEVLTDNELFNRGLFGNDFLKLLNALALFHPFWTGGEIVSFQVQPIPIVFYTLPLLAFLGFWLNRKDKHVTFFAALALFGILLTKQVDAPFSELYLWLFENVPGFNAFREASKFFFIIVLSYSLLIGALVKSLWSQRPSSAHNAIKIGTTAFVAMIFLVNTFPLVTGEMKRVFVPRSIPNDYSLYKKFIQQNDSFSRVLSSPISSRWTFYTDLQPHIDNVDINREEWREFASVEGNNSAEDRVLSPLQKPYSDWLLDTTSVKYVVIPLQDIANDDDFYIHYGGRENSDIRQWYIDELKELDYLERIDIGTEELVIFENKDYKPYISSLDSIIGFSNLEALEEKFSFVDEQIEQEFAFVEFKDSEIRFPSIELIAPYEDPIVVGSLGDNLILNPSFEEGLWREVVGDCNAHDNNPILDMRLSNTATDGQNALELEAARHIACTNNKVESLDEEKTYFLSFDYQSPNGKQAGYHIGFDDEDRTSLGERIPIEGSEWGTFSRQIEVPEGATLASLTVYSYSKNEVEKIITRYDNFQFIELPPVEERYFIFDDRDTEFENPEEVTFEIINPTKKSVKVKGATTPFYLAMSESFHPQWQLQFDNKKIRGSFQSWIPWVNPDRVPDEHHFELNGFLNGWYVDVDTYCRTQELCTANADGTYDMEFVIEFFPQRWFYFGLLISGTTFVGVVGYLIYGGVQSFRRRRGYLSGANNKEDYVSVE